MTATVATVLRDAADLIERDGWCQRAYSLGGIDGPRSVCVFEAVRCSTPTDVIDTTAAGSLCSRGGLDTETLRVLAALIAGGRRLVRQPGDYLGLPVISLMAWNDAPERTKPEVLAALRGAADQWEAENG